MKTLIGTAIAAMLIAAAPAWADRGHKRHHGYYGPPRHVTHVQRYHVYRHWHPRPVVRYYAPAYAVPAYPVYPAYRPAPGVHISLPDVFIRF